MSLYTEQILAFVKQYSIEQNTEIINLREIANWAIKNKKWAPHYPKMLRQCSEDIAKVLREATIVDPQGRKIRLNHVVKVKKGEDQISLWADIRNAKHEHMENSFRQRRGSIANGCRQLKTDIDSFNENYNTGEPIQMRFDFTVDLIEADLERTIKQASSSNRTNLSSHLQEAKA